jgi:hypothetical protein
LVLLIILFLLVRTRLVGGKLLMMAKASVNLADGSDPIAAAILRSQIALFLELPFAIKILTLG